MKCVASTARQPRRPRDGFTLLELMVALTVGGITISSMYAIGAGSTRVFRQQNDIANAQTTLRMAMDQVKRDIARAGYLGTPDASLLGQSCGIVDPTLHSPTGSGRLAAIARFQNDVPIVEHVNDALVTTPNGTTVNQTAGFTADEIVMFGNYSTGAEYPIERDPGDLARVIVQQGFYDFKRDFVEWWQPPGPNPAPFSSGAFHEAFTVGRVVGLRRPGGEYHFDTIQSVEDPTFASGVLTSPLRVQLANGIPGSCSDVGYISPLNAIRYSVQNAPAGGDDGARFAEGTGPVAQLVRTEVQPGDKMTAMNFADTEVPNRRAILDYVVGFHLAFTMTAGTAQGAPDSYVVGTLPVTTMIGAGTLGTTVGSVTNAMANVSGVTGHPERVRAVSVDLAVRTPEQDSRFPWDSALCSEMRCFRVFDDRPGAARVRRLHAEVFLSNVAAAGY